MTKVCLTSVFINILLDEDVKLYHHTKVWIELRQNIGYEGSWQLFGKYICYFYECLSVFTNN